eukprot:4297736-Pleurochrysis_carterae.AAC.1
MHAHTRVHSRGASPTSHASMNHRALISTWSGLDGASAGSASSASSLSLSTFGSITFCSTVRRISPAE